MSCALIFLDRNNLFIGSDTAISAYVNEEYKRVNGIFKKTFIYNNHIYFVSGDYNTSMYVNHLITHKYDKKYIINKLKELKQKIEFLDCYFDNFPTIEYYSYFNNYELRKIQSTNGTYMFSVGYKTKECYEKALSLYQKKIDIINIYKKTFNSLVCNCIGESLDLFMLNKNGPKFIDTYGLDDSDIERLSNSYKYELLIADTIVGNLIAGNNLVIANSTDEEEATFYVDSSGAKLTNADFVLNNTDENSIITMNSKDGIKLVHDGQTVFEANMNGVVTVTGYAPEGDYVTEEMLSTAGSTKINGGNITTGVIQSESGNTTYNLIDGYIISGTTTGVRYEIYPQYIRWYTTNNNNSYLTGVIYSTYGSSFIGANSAYVYYGWCPSNLIESGSFSSCVGLCVKDGGQPRDSQSNFNSSEVNVINDLGVGYNLNTRNLSVWGDKDRIMNSSFGVISMGALESPKPSFFDYGFSKIDENGESLIILDPRFNEAIYSNEKHFWIFQSTNGTNLSYKEIENGCIVYGEKDTEFNWIVISSQYDKNGEYAEIKDIKQPLEDNLSENLAEAITHTFEDEFSKTTDLLFQNNEIDDKINEVE